MKILITGAAGFTAKSLIQELCTIHSKEELFLVDVRANEEQGIQGCDLGEEAAVQSLIASIQPDQIYHLAGSFSNQFQIDFQANVLSSKYLFDSIRQHSLQTRVLLIGSAAEYGMVSLEDNPIKESQPLKPLSVYGLTKVYQTELMQFYNRMYGMNLLMARLFNLSGKGMSERLLMGRLYKQIDQYQKGEIPKIILGNLQSKRDYIPVEEAVRQFRLLMEKGEAGKIYHVASGTSIRMEDLVRQVLAENQLDFGAVEIQEFNDPNKKDIEDIYADIQGVSKILQLHK